MEQPQSRPLRLIDVQTLRLKRVHDKAPPSAILSHTWGEDEISLQEWESGDPAVTLKEGHLKVINACKQAEHDGIGWLWADTCCIDKTNNSELAESIQCMYDWYHNAEVCYVLLSDVDGISAVASHDEPFGLEACSPHFSHKELIAPRRIVFYSKDWTVFDDLPDLLPIVPGITNIPEAVLRHEKKLNECTFAQRLSWASSRETKRIEDQAYSLLGILDVVMLPHYGEGPKALLRLQKVLLAEEGGLTVLAWDSQDPAQSACLLAPSLACFRSSGDIEAKLSSITTAEYSFTNVGLSGYFLVMPMAASPEHMFTPLRCYRKRSFADILALSISALNKDSGRSENLECYVNSTRLNSARNTNATRLVVVRPSQQSFMIKITIRSSPPSAACISDGLHHIGERHSGDWAQKPPRHWSGERLLPPTVDGLGPIQRLVGPSDRFAGDLYKAVVAYVAAAMSGRTDIRPDLDANPGSATGTAGIGALVPVGTIVPVQDPELSPIAQPKALDYSTTGVTTVIQIGSHKRQTDPALSSHLGEAARLSYASFRDDDQGLPRFRVRDRRLSKVGRVLLVLWSEPAGKDATLDSAPDTRLDSRETHGQAVFSQIRRFVVVREAEHSCSALPIVNYGSRGVGKRGIKKSDHSIIYIGRHAPQPLPDERPIRCDQGMQTQAIRVVPDGMTEKLDPMSRLDYARVYTVQHNIKVVPIGWVHPESMDALTSQFYRVWNELGRSRISSQPAVSIRAEPISSVLHSSDKPVVKTKDMMHQLTVEGRHAAEAIDEIMRRSTASSNQSERIMTLVIAALVPQAAAVLRTGSAGKVSVGAVAKQEQSSAEE
ncbi:hypothetical protein LTR17_010877 [Elasticomyces elasticus]|nr:hypothetical protein LTR17_010877 [Elasticomyces elasticus]